MNKKVLGKKFSRDTTSRRAMYRALIRSLVLNQKIVTTYAKAKVILPIIENLMHRAKSKKLSARRAIYKFSGNDREVADKIFEIVAKMPEVKGGYLRSTNLPARKGDNVSIVRLEFTHKIEVPEMKKETVESKKKVNTKKQIEVIQDDKNKTEKSPISVLKKLSFKRKPVKNL